jgi:molybdopterin-guanine dinucleotide biosynthesis protein MobB
LKPVVIAIVGSKKSGKTTAMEALIRELTERGYEIVAAKHISEESFSIDTKGKDTWRFAQAGAKTIIAVSPDEVATIEKGSTEKFLLREILQKCKKCDVILLEGFAKSVALDGRVHKIVTSKSAREAHEATKSFEPILVFTGPFSTENLNLKIPYVDATKDSKRLADIVKGILKKRH